MPLRIIIAALLWAIDKVFGQNAALRTTNRDRCTHVSAQGPLRLMSEGAGWRPSVANRSASSRRRPAFVEDNSRRAVIAATTLRMSLRRRRGHPALQARVPVSPVIRSPQDHVARMQSKADHCAASAMARRSAGARTQGRPAHPGKTRSAWMSSLGFRLAPASGLLAAVSPSLQKIASVPGRATRASRPRELLPSTPHSQGNPADGIRRRTATAVR